MKKLVTLLLTLALLTGVCSAAMADSLCPYEGEEVVYEGYAADRGITEDRNTDVYKNYKALTGNSVSINWNTAPWSDYDTKMATMLNTGDLADISWFRNSTNVIATYGDMGYFLNFMDYLDYMPNLKQYLQDYPQYDNLITADGELYCVIGVQTVDWTSEAFWYNKTQLDALGMDVPATWDEMLECMRAFKAAKPSGTPLITWTSGVGIYEYYLSLINHSETGFYYDGEKWTWAVTDPDSGYRGLVEMMHTLYTEGLISPEFSTMGDDPTFEYDLLPTPVAHEGDKPMFPITVGFDGLNGWGYFVRADVENPELMCSYVDTIISPEAGAAWMWGIEGVTYDYDENGNPYFLDGYTTADERTAAGISNFMDVRYILNSGNMYQNYVTYPEQDRECLDKLLAGLVSGEYTYQYPVRRTPLFTSEENETIGTSTTPMNTYKDENIIMFIDGTRDLSEWDSFVEEIQTTAAWKRSFRPMRTPRGSFLPPNAASCPTNNPRHMNAGRRRRFRPAFVLAVCPAVYPLSLSLSPHPQGFHLEGAEGEGDGAA